MNAEEHYRLLLGEGRDILIRSRMYGDCWKAVHEAVPLDISAGPSTTLVVELLIRSEVEEVILFQELFNNEIVRGSFFCCLHLLVQNTFLLHPTAVDRLLCTLNPTESL